MEELIQAAVAELRRIANGLVAVGKQFDELNGTLVEIKTSLADLADVALVAEDNGCFQNVG